MIKAYVHPDGYMTLPSYVLDALGQPPHVRQGVVIAFARNKGEAAGVLFELALPVSARELKIASGVEVDALVAAGLGLTGAVHALPVVASDALAVVALRRFVNSGRAERIGRLTGGWTGRRFVSDVVEGETP